MPEQARLEICADSLEAALAAQRGGAHRIELCATLENGGTTPSAATMQLATRYLTIPWHALIRPRGYDFCYSAREFETMLADVAFAKDLGAAGIVAGVLRASRRVDALRTARLVAAAHPLPFTFHRAFDDVLDPQAALQTLKDAGVATLLTSGVFSYRKRMGDPLSNLVKWAEETITVMPGGGIRAHNIASIRERSGATWFHSSARRTPRESDAPRSDLTLPYEPEYYAVDENEVRAMRQILGAEK